VTTKITWERLVAIVSGDRAFCEELCRRELLPADVAEYSAAQAERVRIAWTLVQELDVNWAGVEIILRMREDLLATRRQMIELVAELRRNASRTSEE